MHEVVGGSVFDSSSDGEKHVAARKFPVSAANGIGLLNRYGSEFSVRLKTPQKRKSRS
jgi:hypothetical protein